MTADKTQLEDFQDKVICKLNSKEFVLGVYLCVCACVCVCVIKRNPRIFRG